MDGTQTIAQGLTTSDWLAILALCITFIGALLGLVYSNIMKAIQELGEMFKTHVEDDKELTRRVGNHSQRLSKIDGQTESE